MKITILIAQKEGRFPNLKIKHTAVNTLKQANRVKRNIMDRKTYSLIRALEKNEKFVTEVKKLREALDIPIEGYGWQEWYKLKKKQLNNPDFSSWRIKLQKLTKEKLTKQFKIPTLLQGNLPYIVVANCVYAPIPKISIEYPDTLLPVYEGPDIKISIQHPVSKNQLLNFIKANWDTIKNAMKHLGSKDDIFISERDRKIIYLRDKKKLKFSEIADVIGEEVPEDRYGYITEDGMKTAYHTAKDKIEALSKR